MNPEPPPYPDLIALTVQYHDGRNTGMWVTPEALDTVRYWLNRDDSVRAYYIHS